MFAVREIAVSLTFFVLLYCCFSLMVVVGWHRLKMLRLNEKSAADILFLARVLPMLASVAIMCAFVVPSFQLLEPRGIEEETGILPVALGVTAIVFIASACYRVIKAQSRTARMVAQWLERGQIERRAAYTVCSRQDVPPLTLVGLCKPQVLVSDRTLGLLTENEMEIALRHEQAHISSRDNLKKLISQFCPFPGMSQLEMAWAEGSELAADDAAVSSADDAVDLAAALVKLSRLVPVRAVPICTVGFVTGSVGLRVARLLEWGKTRENRSRIPRWVPVSMLVATAIILVATYSPALVVTHEITEFLVR
jgi:Zn-dependent protease with chaperone function